MISEIRKQFKAQGFKAVLWLVIFSMAMGLLLLRRETGISNVLLKINGYDISISQFEQKATKESERIQLLRQQFGPQADMYLQALGINDPKTMAFYTIVRETLLNQIADKIGLNLATGFVVQKLYDPDFVPMLIDLVPIYVLNPDGTINKEKLTQYLHFTGKTMVQFEESLEQAMKRIFVMDIVNLSGFVDPEDVKQHFMQNYLGKQFEILILPLDTFKAKVQTQQVSKEELQAFFEEENRKTRRYWLPEKRAGLTYIFKPNEYGIVVSDQEVSEYYNAHKSKFVQTPVQIQIRRILFKVDDQASTEQVQKIEEKAKKVLQEIKDDPSMFATLAKTHSDDKESAKVGGLMPLFSKGTYDSAFEKAALRLKNDGDISDLIVSNQGFEILQRVMRKPIEYKSLEMVKKDIIKVLQAQKFKNKFTEDISGIMNQAKTDSKVMNDFAQSKNAQKIEIPRNIQDKTVQMQKLFGLKTAQQWTYFVEDNQGVALMLTTIEPASQPSLQQVEKQVKEDYYNMQAKKALREALTQAKKNDQKSFNELAKEFGGTAEKTGFIKKDDHQALEKLSQKNIPTSVLFSLEYSGMIVDHIESNGYLIKLIALEQFDQESFLKEKSAIEQQLYKEQKFLIENGFIASLFRNATIKSKDPQFNIKG